MDYPTLLQNLEKKLKSLQSIGINYLNIQSIPNDELARILSGLDGIISNKIKSCTENLEVNQINYSKTCSEEFIDLKNTQISRGKIDGILTKKINKGKKYLLEKLLQENKSCLKCELGKTRNNLVFGNGFSESSIMFIGEGPGADEDETGMPFVGRAGKLLTKMINSIGLDRQDVYITNIVKCRPPQNRNPSDIEISSCFPILKKQIEIINPKLIVTLGNFPAKTLIPNASGITKIHGEIFQFENRKLLPTFHPSYLLRNRSSMSLAWEDFKKITELAF